MIRKNTRETFASYSITRNKISYRRKFISTVHKTFVLINIIHFQIQDSAVHIGISSLTILSHCTVSYQFSFARIKSYVAGSRLVSPILPVFTETALNLFKATFFAEKRWENKTENMQNQQQQQQQQKMRAGVSYFS